MYKPGTQLIIDDLWAAAAARKLGFEVESKTSTSNDWQKIFIAQSRFCQWRITVTESGPNAAKRFLPQTGDLIDQGGSAVTVLPAGETALFIHNQIELKDATDLLERILFRGGIPFPQFSKVIEP